MSIPKQPENDMEKVSIITPCFNAQRYINETYTSLKNQTYTNWEWVIFDDCSLDNSLVLLHEIQSSDNRVKVFKNMENSGAAVTRNNCLDKAQGNYIAFLDSDDLWVPEKLEKQIHFLKNNKACFIFSDYEMVDSTGVYIKSMTTPNQVSYQDLLKFNPFATSSVFIKREAIETKNIRFLPHLRRRQDYLFWYSVIKNNSPAIRQPEHLSKYRQTGESSLSSNKVEMAKIQWGLYRNEFKLPIFQCIYYFCHYAINGIKKYLLKN